MFFTLELLQELVTNLPDPVFLLTETGRYAAVFGGADPRFYHDGSSLVGCRLHDVLPLEKADWFLEQINISLGEQRLHTVEYGLTGLDVDGLDNEQGPSGEIWFEGRIQPLSAPIDGERAVVWVARNITERYAMEAELRRLSETDALTGAYNRRKLLNELDERFREFQRYKKPASLIILDVDHFKSINDRFGHLVGDEVLLNISQVCNRQLREVDMFARFGGEEFAVLLPNTDVPGAKLTAERLRQAVEREVVRPSEADWHISISLGASGFLPTDKGLEDVLKRADEALYKAKRTGRNRVVVEPFFMGATKTPNLDA